MPKTKLQDLVFSIFMVICMVYCMTFFNNAIEQGVTYQLFFTSFLRMWPEVLIAFFVQRFLARKNADHLLKSYFSTPENNSSTFLIPIINAGGNVMVMAPVMTLIITLLHNGFCSDLGRLWCERVILNFPFALCIQTFYVGPFVRFIYRRLSMRFKF